MSHDDEILEAARREMLARLTAEPCETCGRGKDADGVAATAIAKIINDLGRMRMSEEKAAAVEEKAQSDMNPLAALATAAKLPVGNTTRIEILDKLDGQAIALAQGVKALRKEELERSEAASS